MAIYLDNQATTACDGRVVAAMLPWFSEHFGNPHSTHHDAGRFAAAAVDVARQQIADLIGADPREIIFTSGATEANNLAIKGAARFHPSTGDQTGDRRRIITLATEHECVLACVRDLRSEGFEAVILPVRPDGTLDASLLAEALRTPTLLVSIMAANNEIGTLHDIPALAALARQAGALFHSDIAQAAGKIPLDVTAAGVDLASLSGHKLYGPKGIGALYVRRRPRVRLAPLFSGGGQERGLRSGTIPAPLAIGLGMACHLAEAELTAEQARIGALRDRLLAALKAGIPGLRLNGSPTARLAGNLNLTFPAASATDLMNACPDLHVSTGSACTSGDLAPSHVLTAIGLSAAAAARTLRLGIGRFTSPADIDNAARLLADAHDHLAERPLATTAEARYS